MEITEELNSAHTRAKIGLLQRPDCIFLTSILFSLTSEWSSSEKTACVDGKTITINPKYFQNLNHNTRQTLLAHEAWHVGFKHIDYGSEYDHKILNEAADYVINYMLYRAGFSPIEGWLMDTRFANMSTIQVYNILMKEPRPPKPSSSSSPQGGNGGQAPFAPDDIRPITGTSDEKAQKSADVSEIIIRANTQQQLHDERTGSKSAGSMPGEIETMIEELLNPKLPWNEILQNYMLEFDKSDYSFSKPNRRFFPDFYLPSLYSESMSEIALAYDTSCSVSDRELKQYVTETEAIIKQLSPKRVTVASFDHRLQNVEVLEKDQSALGIKLTGRGGTSLFPVFEYYKKHPPTVLLVFSDLECTPIPFDEKPDFPVIWIVVGNSKATTNFGVQIEYPVGDL